MDFVMSRENFYVVYDGPALANSEMDAKFLAPALLALSEAMDEANAILNGGKAKAHLKVNASFKSGCFGIELSTLVSFVDQTKNLFTGINLTNAASILNWVGLAGTISGVSVLGLIKWVKGRKISRITPIIETNTCQVFIDEDHIVVENEVIALYRSVKFREALLGILSPLKEDGIDEFAVTNDPQNEKFVVIKKDDVANFEIKEQESVLSDRTYETNLQIVGLSFQENNKWKFSDGNAVFHAAILDEQFIKDLNASLLNFSKGDVILADVRQVQAVKNGQIKSEYEIVRVKNIIKALQQLKIPLDGE